MKTASDCPFCPTPPSPPVAENATCVAFRDGMPVSRGHTLVAPRRHVASYFELDDDERRDLVALMETVKAQLDEEYGPDGYNIGINDGPAAGQTIMHLHLHVIPRYTGDAPDPRGGIRWVLPEKAKYWEDEQG